MGTTGQSITLANSIIGVGILAMPFCFQQCGVLLATLILLCMGLVSRLCCYYLLKSALISKRRNFEFLAFHVFGPSGKLAVEMGIIGFLMGTCIAYFVVVGDLGPQIVSKMFNINQSDILRTSIMVIVSLVCVLPLGLLRNVDSLSNVSAATIGFYFCLVIKVIAEATSQLLENNWEAQVEMWKPSGVLQCVPIFSMALFCQTQLFEIFESLPSLSLEKMNKVTKNAINICTGVYFTLGLFGYIAFSSQNISGNILMSLSPTMASDVIKLGFVMSLAFSFPLIIFPCRASLYSFLYKKVHAFHHDYVVNTSIPEGAFRYITVGIIGVTLFISLLIPNIELVLGLVGSTIGVMICIVFPAACFINVTFKNTNERVLAKMVLVLGIFIMVLGTYANLQAVDFSRDRYEDKYTQENIDKIVEDFFESKKLDLSKDSKLKPLQENIFNGDKPKIGNEIIKDSEIQPPNPVPPDSLSDEIQKHKIEVQEAKKPEILPELKDVEPPKIENKLDKPEIHPKDLKGKLNGIQSSILVDSKPDDITLPKEDSKVVPNQEKLDMLKQKELIETIKQHGEEQKELIKEQKEILHELIKTKNELEQNKKDVDTNEAKKIAVESIQQIANMAIQSLNAVTDKPIGQISINEVKREPLEKAANEAVQQIAKKAVETMEAIKEINEKPIDLSPIIQEDNDNMKLLDNSKTNEIKKNLKVNENKTNLHVMPETSVDTKPETVMLKDVKQHKVENNLDLEIKNKLNNPISNLHKTYIDTKEDVAINSINRQTDTDKIVNVIPKKDHLHSADEPLSYKQGEDTQLESKLQQNHPNTIVQNVPLPIARDVRENAEINKQKKSDHAKPASVLESINKNLVQEQIQSRSDMVKESSKGNNVPVSQENNVLLRHKREVIDCTEKSTLKPEDLTICMSLAKKPENEELLSSNIDLNDELSNNFLSNAIKLRTLKSYDEMER